MLRKSIINSSGVEWTDYNCNIYAGCFHDCRYCYARMMTKHWTGDISSWRDAQPVINAVNLAKRDVKRLPPGRIMFCSMTDPYQPIEVRTKLARRVLEVLLDSPFHVLLLTKSSLVVRDFDLFRDRKNIEVGFTITALDDILNWEPYADGNTKRMEALQIAHEQGIKTFASIEPWIPDVTDPKSIIQNLREFVDRFIIGSMQYSGVPREFYAKRLPDLISWLNAEGINYYLKKELKACLTAM